MPYSFGVDFFRHSRPSAERLFGSAWAPPLSLCALWALCVYTLLCQKLFVNANFYIIKISEKENNATYVSAEKEALISVPLKARAERGELAETGEIETAYQNTAGHSIGSGQIYYVLRRHGWQKVPPRGRHIPKRLAGDD